MDGPLKPNISTSLVAFWTQACVKWTQSSALETNAICWLICSTSVLEYSNSCCMQVQLRWGVDHSRLVCSCNYQCILWLGSILGQEHPEDRVCSLSLLSLVLGSLNAQASIYATVCVSSVYWDITHYSKHSMPVCTRIDTCNFTLLRRKFKSVLCPCSLLSPSPFIN